MLLSVLPAAGNAVKLSAVGQARPLPQRLLGASTAPFFEHLLGDAAKVRVLRESHLAFTRFPGGSDANFFDWRKGLPVVRAKLRSSSYVKYWANLSRKIARAFPAGLSYERYHSFSTSIDAETIFVPNLETSTIAEQQAWYQHLAAAGVAPTRIELGNEYYLAMLFDPDSLKRWPDARAALRVMKDYREAITPFTPQGAKYAVQVSPGSFDIEADEKNPYADRLRAWDDAVVPEPWFDAVTLHLYPRIDMLTGGKRGGAPRPDKDKAPALFRTLMAHADDGVDRVIGEIERRLPSKEIWVTEWNMRGASYGGQGPEPVTPAMAMLLNTRVALALLRHPSVTVSLYFMYSFANSSPFSSHGSDAYGEFYPSPVASALTWLNEAANGGATFQRMTEPNAVRISGQGTKPEHFGEIEGGLFRRAGTTTLIVENASFHNRVLDLAWLCDGRMPASIHVLSAGALWEQERKPATVTTNAPSLLCELPPLSIARVLWE